MRQETLRPYFLITLLLGALVLTTYIFLPFLKPLALAMVGAVVLQGLHRLILRVMHELPSLAALLTVVISIVLVLLPLTFIGILVGNEARVLYTSLEQGGGKTAITVLITKLDQDFGGRIPGLGNLALTVSNNIDLYGKQALAWLASNAGNIVSTISSLFFSFFIFFVALYYLLRDGPRVRTTLVKLLPLNNHNRWNSNNDNHSSISNW